MRLHLAIAAMTGFSFMAWSKTLKTKVLQIPGVIAISLSDFGKKQPKTGPHTPDGLSSCLAAPIHATPCLFRSVIHNKEFKQVIPMTKLSVVFSKWKSYYQNIQFD
jgi:hypothetical protein